MNNRVVVAISGGGRTLRNLIEKQSEFNYEIVGVISSSPNCLGNEIAKEFKLPLFIESFTFKNHDVAKEKLYPWLKERDASWIALGGFLKIFPTWPEFHKRIINIHPALLPKFGGKGMFGINVHKAVFDSNEKVSGATIHYVTEKYDEGQIIAQGKVDISDCQSPEEIAAKVFEEECRLFPNTLHRLIGES